MCGGSGVKGWRKVEGTYKEGLIVSVVANCAFNKGSRVCVPPMFLSCVVLDSPEAFGRCRMELVP